MEELSGEPEIPVEILKSRQGDQLYSDENEEEERKERNIDKEIEFENPELPSQTEMCWNFFLTPIVLYAGFGRVVMLYERKSSLLQMAQA